MLRTFGRFQANVCPFQGQAFPDPETRVDQDDSHVPQVLAAFGCLKKQGLLLVAQDKLTLMLSAEQMDSRNPVKDFPFLRKPQ